MGIIEFNREKHWDKIYQLKPADQVSWFQSYPEISMRFISEFGSGKDARVIDVGGGTSGITEALINEGYPHITVLDISEVALDQARLQIGEKEKVVHWIHKNVLDFHPSETYDIWHDRAAFHFLTDEEEVRSYVRIVASAIHREGLLVLATFSENGPDKCSDLPVHRYSQDQLTDLLHTYFVRLECITSDHVTPRKTLQNFTYCAFRRNEVAALN